MKREKKATANYPEPKGQGGHAVAGGEEGRFRSANIGQPRPADLPALCSQIRECHHARQDFLSAETRLTLQIKSICRRACDGDKMEAGKLFLALDSDAHRLGRDVGYYLSHHLQALRILHDQRLQWERKLRNAAKSLPVYSWSKNIHGFGELGLGQIVGECGDLSQYADWSKLWKRMGLAVSADGMKALKNARGTLVGYSPRRRAVMHCIGDAMIKKHGPYREVYLARKIVEQNKAMAEGLAIAPSAKIPDKRKEEYRSEGHIHARAMRYMEKRLLRDLWTEWNRAEAKYGQPDGHASNASV